MKLHDTVAEGWLERLRSYVQCGDETSLAAAYEMGRRALVSGYGLVALSHLHGAAVAALAGELGDREAQERAGRFFIEAVAPFDLALRGYRDSISELQSLTRTLETRVEERTHELAKTERRLRELVEQVPVVLYVAPPHSREPVRYVSPQIAAVTGYGADEWRALPSRWGGRLHPHDAERVEVELAQSVAEDRAFRSEYRILRKDGGVAWVRDEARLVTTDSGRRHRGVWMDVTQLRATEEQLRQAQKLDALGRLAGGVAHDFNNVLTAILSFGRFLRDDLEGHPSLPDVKDILRSAETGVALTRQLLAFSRKETFSPQLVDLNAVVSGMERMLSRLIGPRVKLELHPATGLHPIFADPTQLEQVVLNLVVNAADAMPQGGRITFELENVELDGVHARGQLGAPPGAYVQLAVSDTGVGMDEETRRRIFEPFFTTKAPGKGTGLGLATVFGVVKQLGGDVVVFSAPGRGTTFKLFFPRSWEAQAQAAPSRTAFRQLAPCTEAILLVEDDPQVRAATGRALREVGFAVHEAATLGDAERAIRQAERPFDLLLTDVVLGDASADALVASLRAAHPSARILFMSGHTETALQRQGVSLGNAAFIDKPFNPETLVQTVRAVLDRPEPA